MAAAANEIFKVGEIEVLQKKISGVDDPIANYNGFKPSTTTLPQGYKRDESRRPLPVATVWERDIEVPMRDGVILRADVFRPAESDKVPAIVAWSPYGKSGTGPVSLDVAPGRVGVLLSMTTGFEDFEGPDPGEWVSHGYAVINVDARGVFKSQGNLRWNGTAEGRDGHDAVEYLATLPWCNGRVALMGNSWLAMAQWFIAAEKPPHLTCILPLEGCSDIYRESVCRGGVPYLPFWTWWRDRAVYGENLEEDAIGMLEKYPLMNAYWSDKRANAGLIDIPAYVLASMSTGLHTVGSTRCFEDIRHDKKWLRLHPTQEWHDLYQPESIADFKRFLDFYTKDVKNDWECTPKVRVSAIRYDQDPTGYYSFSDWPVPETRSATFWLSHNGKLQPAADSVSAGEVSYQSDVPAQQVEDDPGFVEFTHTLTEKTTLIGPSKAVLFMSCPDHDDMDIFVIIRKADKNGKVLRNLNIPLEHLKLNIDVTTADDVENLNTVKYIGPSGILRASHRTIDPKLSKPHWPAHDHTREDKVGPGTVVRLEIGMWPAAIQFEAGERLTFRIAGHQMTLAEFVPLRGGFQTSNKGTHTVHYGGQYASYLTIPTVRV